MTVISKKILDADENALEQSNQNALAQVLSSSTTGSQLHIVGDFGNGSSFTGTNLDDTVTITGNLLGTLATFPGNDPYNSTVLDLKDGNDIVNVGGKAIASSGRDLWISGDSGNKTISFDGGIENLGGYLSITLSSGSHTLNVGSDLVATGDISSRAVNVITIGDSNYDSFLNVNGSVISQNDASNLVMVSGKHAKMFVAGSFIANEGDNQFAFFGQTTEVKILGNIESSGYRMNNFGINSLDGSFVSGSLISNKGKNSINTGYMDENALQVDSFLITINGNVEVYDNGTNSIGSYAQTVLEVNGDIINQSPNSDKNAIDPENRFQLSDLDDSLTFLGNFFANSGANNIFAGGGNDDLYIEGNVHAENIGGLNLFDLGSGNDIMTLIGNVTATNGGKNKIDAGSGDDIIHLNGHIDAGALQIDGGEGNDTLILTASTLSRFEANYKDWLVDLSSSGLLASNIETIRLDVRNVQPNKIGWLTDLINQANADGANITLEDKNGNVITEPQLGLAADSGSANAFSIMADQHSADSASARDFANDNYNAAFDQHAQTALIV
ncbi:hypothetical protein [Bartonella sp. HY038]|uniref:hypothetical protein n=1 Tax=Bartonella sp. HY038 TaxID=2759660 RepID=UPI0015F8CA74|nr:hypothetical protein [Bartonella sp. HY038]